MLGQKAKTDHLAAVPLFAGLSRRQLAEIARVVEEVEVPGGSQLATAGELGREMFVLVEGGAKVVRNGRKVAELGAGAVFGEMSVIDHQPRSASVVTTEPSRLLVVPGRAFLGLLGSVPRLAESLLKTLSQRLREADRSIYG